MYTTDNIFARSERLNGCCTNLISTLRSFGKRDFCSKNPIFVPIHFTLLWSVALQWQRLKIKSWVCLIRGEFKSSRMERFDKNKFRMSKCGKSRMKLEWRLKGHCMILTWRKKQQKQFYNSQIKSPIIKYWNIKYAPAWRYSVQHWWEMGCRHSSVDSSVPSILPPWVPIPSTPSPLLSI